MTTFARIISMTMVTFALAAAAHAGDVGQKRVPHVTVEVLGTANWDNVGEPPANALKASVRRGQHALPAAAVTPSARKAEMVRRLFWIALASR